MTSDVHVVLICKSDLAFLPLYGSTVLQVAAERAAAAKCAPSISVWVSAEVQSANSVPLTINRTQIPFSYESNLAEHLQQLRAAKILVHDVQRPLTPSNSFDKVAELLSPEITRVCPAHVVVDTLKIVDDNFIVTGTVNRDQVSALSSPEGYWADALGAAAAGIWSFEVNYGATEFVTGDQEALRIREKSDVLLVESFLANTKSIF